MILKELKLYVLEDQEDTLYDFDQVRPWRAELGSHLQPLERTFWIVQCTENEG